MGTILNFVFWDPRIKKYLKKLLQNNIVVFIKKFINV